MFYYFSSIVIMAFEAICCTIFFDSFCNSTKERKKYKKACLIALMVIAYFICALLLSQWLLLKEAGVILITSVIMMVYFKISFLKSIVFSLLYQGLLLLVDYVAYAVNISLFFSEDMIEQQYALAGSMIIVFGKIILFLCVLIIKNKFGKKTTEMMSDSTWIRFLLFPVCTIVIIGAMTMIFKYVENQTQAVLLYSIAFGMVGMNVFVYYLIGSIIERETELHEKKLFEQQVNNQMEMYRSISENFENQKRKSHEFKNHILCIEGLLKEEQYQELKKYVGEISSNLSSERNAINTNHVIINAILNTKHAEAIGKQIVFVCKVNDLSDINIEDEDIVVLLANLLNNAIEACEKCDGKKVLKLKFVKEEDGIVLSVKNTFNKPLVYENNEIITSKVVSPEEHGVGIKNIVKIVEKYNGSYVIQSDEGEFYFSIIIPE